MISPAIRTYKNAYSGLSKETWMLSLIMLINRSGTMVVPFMTLYLTSSEMGYSIGQAGYVFGIFGAGAFSGAWLGGRLTDRIGFYPVQLITLIGGGILFILLGQMKTYPLICTFTFLLSFVNEAFRPANSTAIAFYSKENNRTRSYALNRLAINLGWAVGSSLGGIIAHFNYGLLFWVDGITNIAAGVLMWFVLKPANYKPEKKQGHEKPIILSAYNDRKYIQFILISILFASCFFQLFTNLPVYFRRNLHLSEPFIGLLMAMNGIIIALIEMILVYTLEGKRNMLTYITIGVFLVGVSFLMLNLPIQAAILSFSMITLVTLGEILSMPFMNSYWISRTQPYNRGQYAAMYTMAWSVAQTLGPIGGSQIAEHSGFKTLWWVVGGILIFAGIAFKSLQK
ncbi:MAG TPA: MFS transporter [Chitinophagaceae bacterium]|nr:MFS transporter [Chitinophagaceae bacterium]